MPNLYERARYRAPEWAREVVLRTLDDHRDIRRQLRHESFLESARLVADSMPNAHPLTTPFKTLDYALSKSSGSGIVAEFGVFRGRTLRRIAKSRPDCHGFDSFQGLPEDWVSHWAKGSFAVDSSPRVGTAKLHVGWFERTIPEFLEQHSGPAAFLHLDADLYSSTSTVLDNFQERIIPGTVLLFDEYFNFFGWQQQEHKALCDFAEKYRVAYDYLAYNSRGEQVAVIVTGR